MNLPFDSSLTREEFMEATTDLWEMAPESARRVDHPAPFPVELPQRFNRSSLNSMEIKKMSTAPPNHARIGYDSIGEFAVPSEADYGAHTARAAINFPATGTQLRYFPELVTSLAMTKKATIRVSRSGLL